MNSDVTQNVEDSTSNVFVQLNDLVKTFVGDGQQYTAVEGINLDLNQDDFFCLKKTGRKQPEKNWGKYPDFACKRTAPGSDATNLNATRLGVVVVVF